MTDVELLEGVLHCQQLLKAMSKPTDDETTHTSIYVGRPSRSPNAFGGIIENLRS
jgi:hypothetical protein